MRLPTLRRTRNTEPDTVLGTARLDRRTKRLVGRLRPGDIAVIDHVDLDRVAADSLVAVGVAAVLNAKPSVSGRYPNLGPEVLVTAGIPLLDDLGEGIFERVREGDTVRIEGNTVFVGGEPVAHGALQDAESVAKAMADAREGLSVQLEAFAANTMDYLKQERDLLLDGVGVPEIQTQIQGRHCLIVVRGYDYKADLDVLRPYIREFKPVLIGVDGVADALVEAGYTPDMIIGDMDSVTDDVLRCGAEVIVHAYPDGRAPGLPRVTGLGVEAITFPAAATSEDLAMLLADEKVTGPAEAVVLVSGQPYVDKDSAKKDESVVKVAEQFDRTGAIVVAGNGSAGGNVVAVVRGDPVLSQTISTVDDANTTQGQLVTTLALVQQLVEKKAGQYGVGDNASALLPRLPQ
ncbi:putative cytokinetic ring protein SteA [Micromonospora sp. DH15]|nr:putative cytokinetic ring protein SteA [Micromonospora sp. DH15]